MSLAALRVMVVEDHGFQRRMALRLLSDLGIGQVQEAADGAAALAVLEAARAPPDVILVAVVAFFMCLIATIYPALRASRTDPASALRYE